MNDKYKDSIYDELKGFFPEEYDLTPEELENLPDRNKSQLDDVELTQTYEVLKPSIEVTLPTEETTSEVVEEDASEPETDLPDNSYEEISSEDMAEEENTKPKAASNKLHDIFDIVEMIAICVACIIVVLSFFARFTVVDGDSMNDTLVDGEYLVISEFMYAPEQGDIVVIQDTAAGHTELQKPLIKRVIAVGGQSVEVTRDGIVTVTDKDGNSNVIDNSFIKQETYEGRYYGKWDIPEGFIFVMGDNRNHSTDSRDFRLGVVDERCVIGKATVTMGKPTFRLFPIDKLCLIPFEKFSIIENPLK